MNLALVQCPACRGHLTSTGRSNVLCTKCGKTIHARDGILDFVAGHASTMLDDIDYDEFYRVDDAFGDDLLSNLRAGAGPRWPAKAGAAIEIGCGTGGFSRALLKTEPPDQMLLTDVSPKMLRICREHLDRLGLLAGGRVSFATYSATEKCLAGEVFDTAFGTSVIHHILDVQAFLCDLRRTLKPTGQAYFIEPNRRFHLALTATLAEIVAYLLARGTSPTDPDLVLILNWVCEVRCNLLHSEDIAFLSTREDKHLFASEEIEALARSCGFSAAEALVCDPDPSGTKTATTYLRQCRVSERVIAEVVGLISIYGPRYFSLLGPNDRSCSYLLYFACGTLPQQPLASPISTPPLRPPPEALLRASLQLAVTSTESSINLHIDGWCLAASSIKWLRIAANGMVHTLPVWLPRPDVHLAINANRQYFATDSLCSGVRGTVAFPSSSDVQTAMIDVILSDGSTCSLSPTTPLVANANFVLNI